MEDVWAVRHTLSLVWRMFGLLDTLSLSCMEDVWAVRHSLSLVWRMFGLLDTLSLLYGGCLGC